MIPSFSAFTSSIIYFITEFLFYKKFNSDILTFSAEFQTSANNAVVTCEIKLFQNYFSLRQRLPEIILFRHVETYLKLFRNYFRDLLQLMNIFKHV